MLLALGELVVGGVLIYSAFQHSPDPRDVLATALNFSGAKKTAAKITPSDTPIPTTHGTQTHGR